MERIESARMGVVLLLFAVLLAAVVIIGTNEMAAHNPVLDRIAEEELKSGGNIAEAKPASDCDLSFDALHLLTNAAHMAE